MRRREWPGIDLKSNLDRLDRDADGQHHWSTQ
jgi:hypothetical protein